MYKNIPAIFERTPIKETAALLLTGIQYSAIIVSNIYRDMKGGDNMLYYIGCRIPRGADCDDGWKCRKGVFCNALEICCMKRAEYEKGMTPSFGYYDKSEGCIFFDDHEQAAEYMEKIKSENC